MSVVTDKIRYFIRAFADGMIRLIINASFSHCPSNSHSLMEPCALLKMHWMCMQVLVCFTTFSISEVAGFCLNMARYSLNLRANDSRHRIRKGAPQ